MSKNCVLTGFLHGLLSTGLLSVRVTCRNELQAMINWVSIKSSITQNFLYQSNGISSVGLIKENTRVQFLLFICFCKFLCFPHELFDIIFCYTSMYLIWDMYNAFTSQAYLQKSQTFITSMFLVFFLFRVSLHIY